MKIDFKKGIYMQPRSSSKKRKTCYSTLINFISHCNPKVLLLAYLALSTPAVLANEAYQVSEQPASFLKPGTHELFINKKDCVQAAPGCSIIAAPLKNPRHFQLWQICESDKVNKLKTKSFEDQLSEMKFVGKNVCNGVVSDEIKSQPSAEATEITKGIALINQLLEGGREIFAIIKKLKELLDLNAKINKCTIQKFYNHLDELDEIKYRKFENTELFGGSIVELNLGPQQTMSINTLDLKYYYVSGIRENYDAERRQGNHWPYTDTLRVIDSLGMALATQTATLNAQKDRLFQLSTTPEHAETSVDLNYPDRVVAHHSLRR
ncbi:MAG: hypothetical protein ACYCQI_08795 [Gammaproteobacteria bacterium]